MIEGQPKQPVVGWLAKLIDRLNDISVSQIPVANFAVVDALDKITEDLRGRLGAAADDSAQLPLEDEARVRLQRPCSETQSHDTLWNDCFFRVCEKAKEEGKSEVMFADVDAMVLERSKQIIEWREAESQNKELGD